MKISFGKIIGESFKWTGQILFRPFSFKKWIILTFIAVMAGYLSFNTNFNVNNYSDFWKKSNLERSCSGDGVFKLINEAGNALTLLTNTAEPQALAECEYGLPQGLWASAMEKAGEHPDIALLAGVICLILVIITVLLGWLSARFRFIFLEDIIKNDASISRPWKSNVKIANSCFLFNLIIGFLSLGIVGFLCVRGYLSLKGIGTFEADTPGFGTIMLAILPHMVGFLFFFLVIVILSFIVENFLLPLMYKRKTGVIKTLPEVFAVLNKNKGAVLLYYVINIGLAIGSLFYVAAAMLVLLLVFFIAALIIGFGVYGLWQIVPEASKGILTIVLFIIGTPLFLCLLFIPNCLYLPVPVFFRTFSLKFLASLDERYDLFRQE